MKFKLACLILPAVILFGACENDKGRELSDYNNASTGDSLLYYFLQLKALEYWNNAVRDTTLRSPEQREKFLRGVEKGISLVTDDDNYNKGLRLGVRLANNLRDFEKKYEVDLNDEIMIASLRNGLAEGNDPPGMNEQREFYRLLDKMKNELKKRKRADADKALSEESAKRGMKAANEKLYYKYIRQGQGEYAKPGDLISIALDYENVNGDNLGLPSPITVTVGAEEVPKVMDAAYQMLNRGAIATFATTAYSLFGSRTGNMGLEDNDIVFVSMILNDIITPSDQNHPGSAVVPAQ